MVVVVVTIAYRCFPFYFRFVLVLCIYQTGAKYCKNNPSEFNKVLSTALISYQKASEVQGRLGEHEERVKSLRGIAGVRSFVVLVVAYFFF